LGYDHPVNQRFTPPLLALGLALAAFDAIDGQPARPPPGSRVIAQLPSHLSTSRQAVLVVTDDWAATKGTLQRFERKSRTAPWRSVGPRVPVVVGRNGAAWGRGAVAGLDMAGGQVKQEGDGKAPAGVFRLGTAFGRGPAERIALPYLSLSNAVECVNDARSTLYNHLVTKQQAGRVDWASSEKMGTEPLYRRGVVVEFNTGQPVPSAGSCIFLHIWKGPDSTTAGCTAMSEADLTELMAWLDPGKKPVLIQMPRDQYRRLKPRWNLP
jgi:D-alanyl-D-alanine dipeptidase